MNLVDEDLIDLVHDVISLFRTKSLSKLGKPLHVTEHHSDLLALTLDFISLGEDFLSKPLREITLNFV
ncbi:MAG: hypothetical protein PVI20_15765 [Desulfobacteraceae bacterium]